MLPDADHSPSGSSEPRVGILVAALVRLDLLTPPVGVGLGPGSMVGAPVPVTAVAEDSDLRPREDDVRPPTESWERWVVDAVAKSAAVQFATKRDLGRRVPAGVLCIRRLVSGVGAAGS